jgi:hypothetical protein
LPARSGRFVEPDQADATCPVPSAKIFLFPSDANHLHIVRIPAHTKGAFRDRHGRRVGMRWTRVALLTRAHPCGRRSRVVLTPRRWRQVGERNFTDDGGKQARSPGRARNKLLKPSRAGMPGDPGATVVTNACVLLPYTRGCGCNGHPAFPAPLLGLRHALVGRIVFAQLGRLALRECGSVSRRHCEERKRRSNPHFLVALWIASLRSQ